MKGHSQSLASALRIICPVVENDRSLVNYRVAVAGRGVPPLADGAPVAAGQGQRGAREGALLALARAELVVGRSRIEVEAARVADVED